MLSHPHYTHRPCQGGFECNCLLTTIEATAEGRKRVVLIVAAILAARKLSNFEGGKSFGICAYYPYAVSIVFPFAIYRTLIW
jgi:hypothetical protein